MSTVATLTKTSSALSADAKNKMKNVGKAGIAAAKLSPSPLTPDSGSRLLAVLATGNGVSAACKLPTGCKKATTVAATRHLLSEVWVWFVLVWSFKAAAADCSCLNESMLRVPLCV